MGTIFGLHKGLEVCGKDGTTAYDNLYVAKPKRGLVTRDLIITVTDILEGEVTVRIKKSNIAYEVDGKGKKYADVIRDIRGRDDCLVIE